jgi:NodT family efflux transporter outer membrane factor (OMF) lipoprotein
VLPRAPHIQVPTGFGDPHRTDDTAEALIDWWSFFHDPNLVTLIDQALHNNQELNVVVQEVLIAQNEVMARRGEYIPTLAAQANLGVDRVGRDTSQGRSDERNDLPSVLPNLSFGLYASWEVDVWSRLRNTADASMYRYLASREGQNFMVTRLVAEIAKRYYELLALDRQLQIVQNNLELQQAALEMVRLQQRAAHVTMLAVRRFEAQQQEFASRQYDLRQRIVETENQINLLVGRFPQPIARTREDFLRLDPPSLRPPVPAQLLENRPDIRQAELELRAAELDVVAARARFYPAIRLDGSVGYQSFDPRTLLSTPDSLLSNLLAGITAPLFNRQAITANYLSATSRQMQAVLRYERAILAACVDVNAALNLVDNLAESYIAKRQRAERLTEAVEISTLLFNSARAEYLEVLTARGESLEAQMDLVETRQRQFAAAIALYQALGGGWHPRPETGINP